jgi:hypothetical protein
MAGVCFLGRIRYILEQHPVYNWSGSKKMNQPATIQQLTDRLKRIEAEIVAMRQELTALPVARGQTHQGGPPISYNCTDKRELKEQVRNLFLALSIQHTPIGAETLQQQMRDAGLTSNELSQSIIAAREE